VNWVNAVVQGILLGGLYALFACGLSLLFGVMRVINLAHGDLAVVAAYLAVTFVPAIGLPVLPGAIVVVLLFAAFGYLLQRSLIQAGLSRGLFTTLLVTFGLSIVLQNVLLEVFSADSHSLAVGNLSAASIRLTDDVAIGRLSLLVFVLAVVVLVALQIVLTRTGIGRLIRAVADDREAAGLSGVDHRHVFGIAAAIAFATIAIAGLAFGAYSSFAPTSGASRLLYAFEAVVIGGLGSLWGTLIGGIVLGVAQAIGAEINRADAVIAGHLVFLVVLALRPEGLTGTGTPVRETLRRLRIRAGALRRQAVARALRPIVEPAPVVVSRSRRRLGGLNLAVAGAVVAVLVFLPFLVYSSTTDLLVNVFILLTLSSMWNLLAGYAGLVSVGQQAYVGLGAYGVLMLAQRGLNPFGAIPLAAIGCAVVALVASWLLFRLRGDYFAIATWVFADACQLIISRFPSLGGGTGAFLPGLVGMDPTVLTAMTYWVGLVIVVLSLAGAYLLLRSPAGLALTAVRDNEIGARSLGVAVLRTRRAVYLAACAGCAAAGGLLAVSQLNVEPTSAFSVQWSAAMIFVTIIGGIGSLEGPVIGTIVYFVLQQTLASYGSWYLIVLGVVAVAVAIWAPRGIWGLVADRYNIRLFPVGYWVRAHSG
jgi:ABC-type branched-subunit amino acid transport system permease subunit